MMRPSRVVLAALVLLLVSAPGYAQRRANKKKASEAPPRLAASGGMIEPSASLDTRWLQEDFPAVCIGPGGKPLVAYVAYDTTADTVRLAELTDGGLVERGALSEPGNAYQPCLACDGNGTVWCVWSQMQDGRWNLLGRPIRDGKPDGKIVTVAASPGNDLFADAKTDRQGRVWVTWQSFDGGHGDIFLKHYDPKALPEEAWSPPIQVTKHPAGDWEPRLAFGAGDEALVVFDTYRHGNFDVLLARVSPDGETRLTPIAASGRYEARAEAAASPDGKTLWVAYEDGPKRWGKDLGSEWRSLGGGLHFDRHLYLARVDLATGKTSKVADVTPLIPGLMATLGTPNSNSICLPEIVVDGSGNPWLFYRHGKAFWQVALTKYNVEKKAWTRPQTFARSTYCQDRRVAAAVGPEGTVYAVWPSDGRKGKQQRVSGIHLARLDPKQPRPLADPAMLATEQKRAKPAFVPVNDTPERPRDEHHRWEFDDQQYTLYWGDFHRHTDFSQCRTSDDGCIVEHFRYAYDASGLDYLSTTDHTDAGKVYHEYEWWQTQKFADMFHNPGFFLAFYAYEREQRWPYGHRNVVFIERGGPIVYIQRANYAASRWATPLPPQDGARDGEIPPWQLWDLLRHSGYRVITMEHTPGGGMGTDWSVYKQIDSQIETLVEIYQGSRNSYEGVGAPQPAVAHQGGPMDFGKFNAGAYQNALRLGHKLGVFASSDHRSTNISFGGVYVKKFDRPGVFEAVDARRTIAATDKIFMEFSCNGHLLGEIFETSEKPTMKVSVRGTAPIRAVTIVRNEANIRRFSPKEGSQFDATFTDEEPLVGENRYYVRVEQTDGNMGWTSPVWATYKP